MTLDEISDYICTQHSITRPCVAFRLARIADEGAAECKRIGGLSGVAEIRENERDAWLLKSAVRTLRNETL